MRGASRGYEEYSGPMDDVEAASGSVVLSGVTTPCYYAISSLNKITFSRISSRCFVSGRVQIRKFVSPKNEASKSKVKNRIFFRKK